MDANGWNAAFGELARATMSSPELERYYSVPITKPRAQLILKQLSLYVRHRRDCWAYVSGNCPVLAVKQKILAHEYEEMIRDAHSEHGHLDLIIRQGKPIGLTAEDILQSKPIPTTAATLYAWGWMCKKKSWLEGLAAMSMTEWNQDDRLLADLGGGHSARMGNLWVKYLGITWDDLPNWKRSRRYVSSGLGGVRLRREPGDDIAGCKRIRRVVPALPKGSCQRDASAAVR
ncbi:MAG: hypothetical protein K0Q83_4198 [Deltaproteobacteria bacterium]|nr:hypothetical protein [Deltaproteobacteria bacterium]